ncbi:cysteine-rich receptor-like protein kinase 1 [Pistacia vera]|uniref:cysteine-rich receptor-like protein kinase 1 n=1 Tax=Pistacia vera TaxID=55513 RepID=UPI001263DC64|nr:cysteine-rich receptor-like protein kinase 1 [Pistacia vera]
MQFQIRIPKFLIGIISIHLAFSMFVSPSFSSSRTSESFFKCGTKMLPTDSYFISNFVKVMEFLSGEVKKQGHADFYINNPPPNIYGLAQCHEDLSSTDCELCFAAARTKVPRCLPSESARIFLDGCFLRYDDYDFFKETIDPVYDTVNCSSPTGLLADDSLHKQFEAKLGELITNVTRQAKSNEGFAVAEGKGGVVSVYALAQCWATVSDEGCGQCLDKAGQELRNCSPGSDGRAMYTGCYMRYSVERFFNTEPEPEDSEEYSKMTIAITIGAISFAILSCFGCFMGYKRLSRKREEQYFLPTANVCGLNFKYETLEKATDCFEDSRKLGQGGAGSVFRGTLPDGRNVAVKRLFFNTREWVDQFFNEVNLISGIEHKNLVKLLGCSIEGPESLLVYEYVPNRSLDQILFVKNTIHILSWQQRFTIICGTAEGLAYLHGGTGTKIIHRDIKASNILLDEKLTPKIADFGLARCVSPDRSHVSTGIAGTLGYMAPEYLVRGQLTEKADVYGFGVLVIEIASGRKNSVFSEGSASVLHTVWRHYKEQKITHSVDAGLAGRFPEKEASNVLQIGLLCTQASWALRPSMSQVVEMLNNKDYEIPSPKQPPFLNASVITGDEYSCKDSIVSSQKSLFFTSLNESSPVRIRTTTEPS